MQFSSVVGHQELKRHLIDEVNHDMVSHAQLFLGKTGYGTLPLALAFVQFLFCENKGEKDSCGECAPCRKVQKLQHPDLHFSFPSVQADNKISNPLLSEWREKINTSPYFNLTSWIKTIDNKERKPIISVHESDEIIKKLSLKSFEGGYKVMIIWMAEKMNPQCANKLLKIIEEPPKNTLFILLAESQDLMLQTILSRTQVVNVPRISMDNLSKHLQENYNVSASNADSTSARVDGDLIEAIEFIGDHEEQDENRELFIQLMRVCYKKNVVDMLTWAESIAGTNRNRQQLFLTYSLHMFRQSILRNYTEDHLTRVSEEENQFLNNFSKFISGNNVFNFMETFNDAHYHIERNANAKILFTNLCFQVMRYIHVA